jgi:tRNA dimethylallyltransferase
MLRDIDYESYVRLHPNDTKRIIRALEVHKHTGKTISQYQQESKQRNIEYNIAYIGLNMDRARLYERINQRVDKMFDMNLVGEVKKLVEMGYNKNMNAMQGIGYKEVIDYFDGIYSLGECIDIIKQSSRRYAKRQLTWFRRENRIHWVEVDKFENNAEIMQNIIGHIEGYFKNL